MKINKKLSIIASMIKRGSNVIDIGADHALLDIFLTLYNDNHCIAVDIKKSALEGAFRNIKKYHLENKIILVKSDGFTQVEVRNYETVVISGMGTSTILNIIANAPFEQIDNFIISSNNDLRELRYAMMKMKFQITDEIVVQDNGIFYVIIQFRKGKVKYSEKELQYGPILLKQQNVDVNSYFRYLFSINNDIIRKLPATNITKKYQLWKENLFLKRQIKNHL